MTEMTVNFDTDPATKRNSPPVAVQILSTLMFGAFAITAVVLGFVFFWPAAVAVALIVVWRGGFGPQHGPQPELETLVSQLGHREGQPRPSGNASFDAYRADMLARLEQEQHSFEGFLERLRAAKDKSEFDRFMDQRAQR